MTLNVVILMRFGVSDKMSLVVDRTQTSDIFDDKTVFKTRILTSDTYGIQCITELELWGRPQLHFTPQIGIL